ncbi:MAG TPA: trypsin-like peptidase domain-containing protein [Candidatus Saccharibacteria bacterium]|nr:trypsin-like peptidase domain-containing protein [Candidatus Saccharibacteria bacterium]
MEQQDNKTEILSVTPKQRRTTMRTVSLIVVAFMAGFLGSWAEGYLDTFSVSDQLLTAKDDGNKIVTESEQSISNVAKKVSPSVVSIVTSSEQLSPFFNQTVEQQGAGTGMIVSKNGYILTNKHVIEGADSVTVVLSSGKIYEDVDVLGSDPLNDVAFLKIHGVSNLPAVTLGDSKTVRIGQSVVAIGNALGQFKNTVTSGIISGTGRPVTASTSGDGTSAESLTDLLQTDAAINSGNSGGPLLNLEGQVIGINTAIAQDAQSIGFAIPISATKGMLENLIAGKGLKRAILGVQYVSITPEVKAEYKLPVSKGDYITAEEGSSVLKNGPADKAGIKNGDIIVAFNGYKVGEVASVSTLVSEHRPGDTVKVTVLRNGKEQTFDVTLGVYTDN